MSKAKRKAVQFFTYKEMNLALCDDGSVWSFETAFVTEEVDGKKTGVEKIVWKPRPELQNPGN